MNTLKKIFVGRPLATAQARHERLGKVSGLAVFASDNLSSVAYATEEILRVLLVAGTAALSLSVPIGIAIGVVIAVVITSYRQTIAAYPQGASDYIVAKDNLGVYPGLIAGAALLIDYTLTVAVSVSAGVAALTSAFAVLYPYRVLLGAGLVAGVAFANLRGIRESAKFFAVWSYLFIGGYLMLMVYGFVAHLFWGAAAPPPPPVEPSPSSTLGIFLLLRAFASGAVALTGIEAVSDGVTGFKPPEVRNAQTVLVALGVIMITLFVGITVLAASFGIAPRDEETVVSQLARQVFGGGLIYYFIQAISMVILVLAANTAFADFPRLAFFMARDGYLPRQFASRGDRLVYSNGVIILAAASAVLIVVFHGSTHALIPLYAVGVFTSFTLSQSAMVRRWLRQRPVGWWWRAAISGVGAATTGLVMMITGMTKFMDGAWIVVILAGALIAHFLAINRHYQHVAGELSLEGFEGRGPMQHTVLVLVGDLHKGVIQALQYAQTLSASAKAVYVEMDPEKTRRLEEKWGKWGCGLPLVVLTSPYRSLLTPFLEYLDHLLAHGENHIVTIIIPEFIPVKWWQHLLHNQTALLIKGALLFRKNVVVADVPYHLSR
ncbi:MAG: APC family permease [Candidatus Rokubacteria bacterium]|nr:APC family permease [Candidatus Rokubacteria bacterium]MBI3109179.1 APC family permease [Candidatus Rokubacteria bacterium]